MSISVDKIIVYNNSSPANKAEVELAQSEYSADGCKRITSLYYLKHTRSLRSLQAHIRSTSKLVMFTSDIKPNKDSFVKRIKWITNVIDAYISNKPFPSPDTVLYFVDNEEHFNLVVKPVIDDALKFSRIRYELVSIDNDASINDVISYFNKDNRFWINIPTITSEPGKKIFQYLKQNIDQYISYYHSKNKHSAKINEFIDLIKTDIINKQIIDHSYKFIDSDICESLDFVDKFGKIRLFYEDETVLFKYECYERLIDIILDTITCVYSKASQAEPQQNKKMRGMRISFMEENELITNAAKNIITDFPELEKDTDVLVAGILKEMISVNILYRLEGADDTENKPVILYPQSRPKDMKQLLKNLESCEETDKIKLAKEIAGQEENSIRRWQHYHTALQAMIKTGMNTSFKLEQLHSNGAKFSGAFHSIPTGLFVNYKENQRGLIDLVIYYIIDTQFYGVKKQAGMNSAADIFTMEYQLDTNKLNKAFTSKMLRIGYFLTYLQGFNAAIVRNLELCGLKIDKIECIAFSEFAQKAFSTDQASAQLEITKLPAKTPSPKALTIRAINQYLPKIINIPHNVYLLVRTPKPKLRRPYQKMAA